MRRAKTVKANPNAGTRYIRVTMTGASCAARKRVIRVQAEISKDGRFSLHRDPWGGDGWTVGHLPSGMVVHSGMAQQDAVDVFVEVSRSDLDWSFTTAAGMSREVKQYGAGLRRRFRQQYKQSAA
jgi:hypothetical protein